MISMMICSFSKGEEDIVNRKVSAMECRMCGYEPASSTEKPHRCPKCHGQHTFHLVVQPGSILAVADNYPEDSDPRVGFKRFFVRSPLRVKIKDKRAVPEGRSLHRRRRLPTHSMFLQAAIA